MKTKFFVSAMLAMLVIFLSTTSAPIASADTSSSDFSSFALGNINGQFGWASLGSAGSGCAVYDVAVVNNTYGFPSMGTKVLRMSNSVVSGCFGDQTFAKPLIDAVGESSATDGPFSEGARQRHFEMQFDIATAVPTAQPTMYTSVSPDRGDGSRMSYLRFEDSPAGINVFFDDVQQTTPCTPASCANFVETQIATGLTRTVPHNIKLTMDMLDGQGNDIVKVYIDAIHVWTGTSWEGYYRNDPEAAPEQSTRIIKTILFREGGATGFAENAGKGFLFGNVSLTSGVPADGLVFNPNTSNVAVGGTTTVNIELDKVTNLYGYQFQVNYNASKVSAVGAFVNTFFNTTGGGGAAVPPGWNAACATGVCKFAATLVGVSSLTGSGTIGQITFTGLVPGTVNLTFSGDTLSDRNGTPLVHSVSTGTVNVYGTTSVSGTVALQGRSTPIDSGTVTLTDLGGNFFPMSTSFDATTGAFSFLNVPTMSGGSSYQFDAYHSLYLSNRQAQPLNPGVPYTAPPTTLLGGDATNDGTIDISDLTCIGGAFGGAPTDCGGTGGSDINKDTTVNILDLVLAGGNWHLSSPQNWGLTLLLAPSRGQTVAPSNLHWVAPVSNKVKKSSLW